MNREGVLACCAVCEQQTHRRCSRCLSIYYCNTDHQRQDWRRHRSECLPKLTSQKSKSEAADCLSPKKEVSLKEHKEDTSNKTQGSDEVSNKEGNSAKRRSRKSKKKNALKEGSTSDSSKQCPRSETHKQTSDDVSSPSEPLNLTLAGPASIKNNSVTFSVVYTNKELNKESAITYEGSSEKEILSESAQQLSTVDFATASSSNVLKMVNRTDIKMPILPSYGVEQPSRVKEYPEATLKGSTAPFNQIPNSYYMDPSDPCYEICQRVIRDMTQYGVCVLDNFVGKERGLLVLDEVLKMYRSGIFTAGQLVSNPGSTTAQTVRSDRITWIDGKETHCNNIRQLISQVDNIVLRANKMANNGKMGDYVINGRTKAMVACYPGSGSHYVKHVDNPNKDGRCITAIYYLNLDWDVKRSGGLLRVFPEGTNKVADIAPIFDRMLFFWSDRRNPHEVQPAYDTRYAITLWYFDAHEREIALRNYKEHGQPSSSK